MTTAFIPADRPIIDPLTGSIDFQWLRLFDNLVNGSGTIPWSNINFTGSTFADLVTRSATALSSGTVPLARLSGITTTQLAAAAGILLAQLAVSGSASGATFLRGDSTWAAVSQLAFYGRASAIGAGTTNYLGISSSTTEADEAMVVPVSGTIRNLYVISDGSPAVGQTFTYTARKNAVDQTVTCVISGAAVTANDATHSFTVSAGDSISVKLVTSAGASVRTHHFGLEVATA